MRVGDDLDLWDQLSAFNESGHPSPAKGFLFDATPVINAYTACNNVKQKYVAGFQAGIFDVEETLEIFNKELKDAGLDDIIAEKQAQFDAWLEAQK